MVFVMFWKMLRYQSKKCFADVCLYVVTKYAIYKLGIISISVIHVDKGGIRRMKLQLRETSNFFVRNVHAIDFVATSDSRPFY